MSERAVSVALDYVILFMLATLVFGGVVTVSATLIDDQVHRGVEDELRTLGESVAGDVQDVERLVNSSNGTASNVTLTVDLPATVSGEGYDVAYDASTDELTLRTTQPDITMTVSVGSNRTAPTEGWLLGGP